MEKAEKAVQSSERRREPISYVRGRQTYKFCNLYDCNRKRSEKKLNDIFDPRKFEAARRAAV